MKKRKPTQHKPKEKTLMTSKALKVQSVSTKAGYGRKARDVPGVIVKAAQPPSLAEYKTQVIAQMDTALVNMAGLLSNAAQTPLEMALLHDQLKAYEKDFAALKEMVRVRAIDFVLQKGHAVPDTKSKEAEVDGQVIRIQPHKTTTDPKKYEGLMRAKGLTLERGADQVITYKPNEHKLDGLVDAGALTKEERESARYEVTWVLKAVRPVGVSLLGGGEE